MKLGAALLLLAFTPPAAASVIESDIETKRYKSRAACEKALRKLHVAAVAERAAAEPDRRARLSIEAPHRDDDGHLIYWEVYDGTMRLPDAVISNEATDQYRCKGARLEHQAFHTGGGIQLFPPPPPPRPTAATPAGEAPQR